MAASRTWSGLWVGLIWFVIGFVVVLSSQFIAAAIVAMWQIKGFNVDRAQIDRALGDGDVLSLTFFIALPILLLLVYPWVRYWHKQSPMAYLGINAVPPRSVATWFGMMLIILAIYLAMGAIMGRPEVPEWMLDTWRTVDNMAAFVVAVAILGPLFEEVLCRGYVLRALADSRVGSVWGSIIVSALWAIMHFQYDAFDVAWIFLLGLLLCGARIRTGSLVTPIVLHGMWNFISTVSVFFYLK